MTSPATVRVRLIRLDGSTMTTGQVPPPLSDRMLVQFGHGQEIETVQFQRTATRDDDGATVYEELHPGFQEEQTNATVLLSARSCH